MKDYDRAALRLPALPEFEPAPDLWARIERGHVRRQRRRRLVAGGGLAAVLMGAVSVFAFHAPTRGNDMLAEQSRETLRLEQDWQSLGEVVADTGYARLRPIDVALQQAYDQGAQGGELDRLWTERNQTLRDLIQTRRGVIANAPESSSLISI